MTRGPHARDALLQRQSCADGQYGNSLNNSEGSFRGNHHSCPYGERNLVVPLNKRAALAGSDRPVLSWLGGAGAGKCPLTENQAQCCILLTFLPAGRMGFDIEPPRP